MIFSSIMPAARIAGMARPLENSNEFFDIMEKLTFTHIDDKTWDQIFNINFYGAVYAAKAVLPIMMKQGSGHIINISSKAGKIKGRCSARHDILCERQGRAFQVHRSARV